MALSFLSVDGTMAAGTMAREGEHGARVNTERMHAPLVAQVTCRSVTARR